MSDKISDQNSHPKKGRSFSRRLIILLVVIAVIVIYWNLRSLLGAVDASGEGQLVSLHIANGSGASEIGQQLYDNGLIKNNKVFYWYAFFRGATRDLQSGSYVFSTEQSVPEIMERLLVGKVEEVDFTIPEGYNLENITSMLSKEGLIDEKEFTRLLTEGNFSYDFLPEIAKSESWLEGYLFPETYSINRNTTEEAIINLLLKQFGKVMENLDWQSFSAESGYNLHQIVTIASIIEKESGTDADRPLIASVIYNRMDIGMKLDIDATLIYVLHKNNLTNSDKKLKSPYNTYLYAGLPPGPIASPGKASLKAALCPAETDYYYYVLDPDTGGHVFSETYAEHLRRVEEYLSKKL